MPYRLVWQSQGPQQTIFNCYQSNKGPDLAFNY